MSFLMMVTVMQGIKHGKKTGINVQLKLKLSLFMPWKQKKEQSY